MGEFYLDAGEMRERVGVLTLSAPHPAVFEWKQTRTLYAKAELTAGRNLFSSVGIGAKNVTLLLRYDPYLSEENHLLWRGKQLCITALVPRGRQHLEVTAAMVTPVSCVAEHYQSRKGASNRPTREKAWEYRFPAIVTEKYVGYGREDSHGTSRVTYVLITPKAIGLTAGDVVTIEVGDGAGVYHLTKCHVLDDMKNEYEMERSGDV